MFFNQPSPVIPDSILRHPFLASNCENTRTASCDILDLGSEHAGAWANAALAYRYSAVWSFWHGYTRVPRVIDSAPPNIHTITYNATGRMDGL
jgi:hypothetical protein